MRQYMLAAAALAVTACIPGRDGMINADSAMIASKASAAANMGVRGPMPTDMTGMVGMGSGPQAIVTVLYLPPTDAAAFEAYYPGHLQLLDSKKAEIGFTKGELTKFSSTLDGQAAPFYRQAELYFPNMDALKKGVGTPGFKAVADDLANFASGGLVALVAEETGTAADAACPALVTVIYEQPKDAAAFEAYYPGHGQLLESKRTEIGFVRADLTKFVSALDGSPAPKYRQAEVCFSSAEARTKGLATPGFAAVAGDLPNFATGGLVALLGDQPN